MQAVESVRDDEQVAIPAFPGFVAGREQKRAVGAANSAEALARSVSGPGRQAEILVDVAGALARVGQHERAETIAWAITEPVGAETYATWADALRNAAGLG